MTDLRRRDRELITKDTTIREIHHRVKNNLQTVAALLRLQARRIDSAEATAALEEAVRRVGSIAIVHETLSQAVEETVDFDEIADRLARLVTDVGLARGAGPPGGPVRDAGLGAGDAARDGPDRAAPERRRARLSGGRRRLADRRPARSCCPRSGAATSSRSASTTTAAACRTGFDLDGSPSLGLSIVKTLVESELGGHLTLGASPAGGTRADLSIPLD